MRHQRLQSLTILRPLNAQAFERLEAGYLFGVDGACVLAGFLADAYELLTDLFQSIFKCASAVRQRFVFRHTISLSISNVGHRRPQTNDRFSSRSEPLIQLSYLDTQRFEAICYQRIHLKSQCVTLGRQRLYGLDPPLLLSVELVALDDVSTRDVSDVRFNSLGARQGLIGQHSSLPND